MLNETYVVVFDKYSTDEQTHILYEFFSRHKIKAPYSEVTVCNHLKERNYPALKMKTKLISFSRNSYETFMDGTADNPRLDENTVSFNEYLSKLKKLVIRDSRMASIR